MKASFEKRKLKKKNRKKSKKTREKNYKKNEQVKKERKKLTKKEKLTFEQHAIKNLLSRGNSHVLARIKQQKGN